MSHQAFEFSHTTPQELFRILWTSSLLRSDAGTPIVTPDFVAEQGQYVHLYDVRDPEELLGIMGYIPGSTRIDVRDLAKLAEALSPETPVVFISNTSTRARKAASYLEMLGMKYVAAMRGGMVRWKTLGFAISRSSDILEHSFSPPHTKPPILRPSEATPLSPHEIDKPYDAEEVKHHLGNPRNVRWQKLASMLAYGKRSCVDGREDKGVIGTPGGDAGEFLLTLTAAEQTTGQPIPDTHIEPLFHRYLDVFGRFYMHTDTHAFSQMIQSIRKDPVLKDQIPPMHDADTWTRYCNQPPVELREALLQQLLQPAHVGCGHLRLMLLHPEEYGVRIPLIHAFLRAFHHAHWQQSPDIDFVILGGHHAEEAVVNVTIDRDVHAFTKLPLISPSFGTHQMFIHHPQVGEYLRKQSAFFMLQQPDLTFLQPTQKALYLEKIKALAQQHLAHTLRHLAGELPIYQAQFHGAQSCAVSCTLLAEKP